MDVIVPTSNGDRYQVRAGRGSTRVKTIGTRWKGGDGAATDETSPEGDGNIGVAFGWGGHVVEE